jgi:hypothetical protein
VHLEPPPAQRPDEALEVFDDLVAPRPPLRAGIEAYADVELGGQRVALTQEQVDRYGLPVIDKYDDRTKTTTQPSRRRRSTNAYSYRSSGTRSSGSHRATGASRSGASADPHDGLADPVNDRLARALPRQ